MRNNFALHSSLLFRIEKKNISDWEHFFSKFKNNYCQLFKPSIVMFGCLETLNLLDGISNPNFGTMVSSLDDSFSASTQPLSPQLVANASILQS